jgi:hypothetical protein
MESVVSPTEFDLDYLEGMQSIMTYVGENIERVLSRPAKELQAVGLRVDPDNYLIYLETENDSKGSCYQKVSYSPIELDFADLEDAVNAKSVVDRLRKLDKQTFEEGMIKKLLPVARTLKYIGLPRKPTAILSLEQFRQSFFGHARPSVEM